MPADQPDEELRRLHEASPLTALSSHGFGPLADWMPRFGSADELRKNPTFVRVTLESLGATAHAILRVVDLHDGFVDAERWHFETLAADEGELAEALERLQVLGFARQDDNGGISGVRLGAEWFGELIVSYDDPHAITSDRLAAMIQWWGLAAPGRKSERSALLRDLFSGPDPETILGRLSPEGRALFARIAEAAGPRPVDPELVGVESYQLYLSERSRYGGGVSAMAQGDKAFVELVGAGLVGYSTYEREIWIWVEAWPLAQLPLIAVWPSVPAPSLIARQAPPPRLSELVTVLGRALAFWDEHPPKVLKNNAGRFGKSDIRAAARELGVGEDVIEAASRFLIENELFLSNVVSTTGRGRNRKIDSVWMADPDVIGAWSSLTLIEQWLVVVQQWMSSESGSERAAAARQLVLYELLSLPSEMAWADRQTSASWLEHRYAPLTDADEFATILEEASAIGLVEPDVVALTTLGRRALLDAASVRDIELGGNDTFIVQPDLSVVAPPDLTPEVAGELAAYATLHSSAGALIYHLDESLITRAVQRGTTPEAIAEFLTGHAGVPVPGVVLRFIDDAARRADRFALHATNTVLVTSDPVDLADAVAVKAAKLVKVSDTVAVSALTPDKVRAALGKRKLEARIVGEADDRPTAQRSADKADAIAAQAAQLAEHAERSGYEYFRSHAEHLRRQAEQLRNPSSRFRLAEGPLAFDPALMGRLPPETGEG